MLHNALRLKRVRRHEVLLLKEPFLADECSLRLCQLLQRPFAHSRADSIRSTTAAPDRVDGIPRSWPTANHAFSRPSTHLSSGACVEPLHRLARLFQCRAHLRWREIGIVL